MEKKPLKLEKTLEYEEVLDNRYLSCESYDECLSYAMRNRWTSFSCKKCPTWRKWIQDVSEQSITPSIENIHPIVNYLMKKGNIEKIIENTFRVLKVGECNA